MTQVQNCNNVTNKSVYLNVMVFSTAAVIWDAINPAQTESSALTTTPRRLNVQQD